MYKATMRLSFKFLALGILTGALVFFYYGPGFSQVAPLRVVVADQPDSPLLILPTFVDSSKPLQPLYWYSITNRSDKPISALAIQQSVRLGSAAPIVGTTFTHFPAVTLFFGPHESKQEVGGYGRIYQQAPSEVDLVVDFVEFSDGTRWGNDTNKSGEMLDGKRAGGKAAIKKYREILTGEGLNALEQALLNPNLIQPDSNSKSDAWLAGFNGGVNSVKSRLEAAKGKNGQDGLKRELAKPFDSTDGRQEP